MAEQRCKCGRLIILQGDEWYHESDGSIIGTHYAEPATPSGEVAQGECLCDEYGKDLCSLHNVAQPEPQPAGTEPVARFELEQGDGSVPGGGGAIMLESPWGDYIKFEDYAALREELEQEYSADVQIQEQIAATEKDHEAMKQSHTRCVDALGEASRLIDALEACHICGGAVIVEDGPIHCEDCSADCDAHDAPDCASIYDLHQSAKLASRAALDTAAKLESK